MEPRAMCYKTHTGFRRTARVSPKSRVGFRANEGGPRAPPGDPPGPPRGPPWTPPGPFSHSACQAEMIVAIKIEQLTETETGFACSRVYPKAQVEWCQSNSTPPELLQMCMLYHVIE